MSPTTPTAPSPSPSPSPQPPVVFTISRSAIETRHACPRMRWWAYEYGRNFIRRQDGRLHTGGLQTVKKSIYTLTGSTIHMGVTALLAYSKGLPPELNPVPPADYLEHVIKETLAWFRAEAAAGLLLHDKQDEPPPPPGSLAAQQQQAAAAGPGPAAGSGPAADDPFGPIDPAISAAAIQAKQDWIIAEQATLAEGLIRVFHKLVLPSMLQVWEVLSVEADLPIQVPEVPGRPMPLPVILQSKADAILRSKISGEIMVYSLKCLSAWEKSTDLHYRIDTQGLTEGLVWDAHNPSLPVSGTLLQVLLKGRRNVENELGFRAHNSPLTRCWFSTSQGVIDSHVAWAWSNRVRKPENKSGWGILGKGWESAWVWQRPGGVKQWVEDLFPSPESGKVPVQPEMQGDLINALFMLPEPYGRRQSEMKSALRMIAWEEAETAVQTHAVHQAGVLSGLQSPGSPEYDRAMEILDFTFPMRRNNCTSWYGDNCWAWSLCHQGAAPGAMLAERLIQLRTSHHEELFNG